jgi:hypothetical protein
VVEELRNVLLKWCIEEGDQGMVRGGQLARSALVDPASASFADGIMGWRWY